jgi:hypothetical protein
MPPLITLRRRRSTPARWRITTLDPAAVVSAIEAEPYTLNVIDPVIREFQAAFNRAPDPAGGAFWTHQLGAGSISLAPLGADFAVVRP